MKIYTGSGDRGTTSLTGGERVDKWDARVEAYGEVDELQANVALLLDTIAERSAAIRFDRGVLRLKDELEQIVATLMTVAALFSQGGGKAGAKNGPVSACEAQAERPGRDGRSSQPAEAVRQLSDLSAEQIKWLEERIDAIAEGLAPLRTFTLPGGHPTVSMAHVCRTVCRRAERTALAANAEYPLPGNALVWLNRLSDYFYVVARELSVVFGVKEKAWVLE